MPAPRNALKPQGAKLITPSMLRKGRRTSALDLAVMELPGRQVSEYTLERLGCAIRAVDGGSIREAADLTRAAITMSGFISGVLETITSGILGLPRTFVGGSPEVRRALEGDDDHESEYDLLFPRSETKRLMAWGFTLGIGLGQFVDDPSRAVAPPEHLPPLFAEPLPDGSFRVPAPPVFAPTPGANRTPSLLAWDPRWLRYQWHDDTWHLMTAGGEIQIEPGDGEWVLFTPYSRKRPWEHGAWMSLVLAFIMQRDGTLDRARHSEMLAPVRVGTVPEGTSEEQRQLFAAQIRAMQRFPWFVLPPGLKYDVVEAKGATGIIQTYKDMIDSAEADVMVRLTGNKVMVEGSPGFSKGDFQQRVTASMRQSYASDWAECARAQGIAWWTRDNYPSHVSPRVAYNTDPPEDRDAEIKRLGDCGDALAKLKAGLGQVGFELDDDDGVAAFVAKATGFKVRKVATPKPAVSALPAPPAVPARPENGDAP